MLVSGNGQIKYEYCSSEKKNDKVSYTIDSENHHLELVFIENDLCEGSGFIKTIELLTEDMFVCTFYNCHIIQYSKRKSKILYEVSIEGSCIPDINGIQCTAVEYTINANPIPIIASTFLPENSEIESANIIVKCGSFENDVVVTLEAKKDLMPLDDFETVFFNVLDITFLANGYYPYIISEAIIINEEKLMIDRLQQSIYKKEHSFSHWKKVIAGGRNINLNDVYPKYLKVMEGNRLIIPVLRSVIHCEDIYKDLVLCNLIQCVEGYMRRFHVKEKYSQSIVEDIKQRIKENISQYQMPENSGVTIPDIKNSIMGLIGMINQPNFKECLRLAIYLNESTKLVFSKEIESKQIEEFIKKSAGTRNQFSHMNLQKMTIEGAVEIYQAIEKYGMLLRIIILGDIDIKVKNDRVSKWIAGVNFSVQ